MVFCWSYFCFEYVAHQSWIYWYTLLYQRKKYQVCNLLNIFSPFFCLQISFCYRTVLLHSERMIYIYGFTYTCFPFLLDVLRIYIGPFSGLTCWWYKFFKNFGPIGGQLSFICTILIRVSAFVLLFAPE